MVFLSKVISLCVPCLVHREADASFRNIRLAVRVPTQRFVTELGRLVQVVLGAGLSRTVAVEAGLRWPAGRYQSDLTSVYKTVYNIRTMLTITIDRGVGEPVYAQVAHQLRQLIASGALSPGMTLPSVRGLAGDLGVNLNTIARAYRLLEGEGFLVILGRSGVKVAAPAEEVDHSTHAKLLEEMRTTLARLRQGGATTDELLGIVRRELLALDEGDTEN